MLGTISRALVPLAATGVTLASLLGLTNPSSAARTDSAHQAAASRAAWIERAASARPPGRGQLAAGVLTSNGRPLANAEVFVRVWPNSKTLAHLPKGAVVPILDVGTVRTDDAGAYQVDLRPSRVPARYRDAGLVDVEVIAATARREMRWGYTVRAHQRGDDWSLAQSHGKGVATRLDFGLGLGLEVADDPRAWRGKPGAVTRGVISAARVAVQPRSAEVSVLAARARGSRAAMRDDNCDYQPGTWYLGRPQLAAHIQAFPGVPGKVTMTVGNEHVLGIGVSLGGGNWSQGGTQTESFTATASQSGIVNRDVYNKINYRDFTNQCANTRRLPISANDLISDLKATIVVGYAHCQSKSKGYEFMTSSANNVTYTSGVDIGPINVSSRSGWGSGVALSFKFDQAGKLCFTNSAGPLQSSRIETRAP